ncbi:MAG: flippase-like domain-containing protein [Gemmatimonadaceae bacterium]|nr:flippase-like domain-containing protein [Gemmatimonadaceae bacterium]
MKPNWRSIVGILLSAGLIYWTLRGVSMAEVWRELSHANWYLLLGSSVCATLIFPLRARRWRPILDPVAPDLPFSPLWRSTAIGMMVNNVLPARAGEVARAYALTRETGVPFATGLASLAVDRLLDSVVLLGFMGLAFFDPALRTGAAAVSGPLAAVAGGGGIFLVAMIGGVFALVFFPRPLIRLFEIFSRRISPSLEERGKEILERFIAGLSVLRRPDRFAAILSWTTAHWLLNAVGYLLAFRAFGITAPFSAALFLLGFIALGAAVPSAPGFFGVFEYMAVQGLAIYSVPKAQATSWAIGFHILSFIPITIIGGYYFTRLGLGMAELQKGGGE